MRNAFSNSHTSRGAKTAAFSGRGAWILAAAALLALAAPVFAEHTRWWRQSSFEDFDKGTAKGVALRSDGKLFLAPRFAEFADANLAYLLQIKADSKGNLYAAGGSNAKVLRIDSNGKSTSVFESPELTAQALALDASGNLYVGTSPDGKVYKVTPAGQSSVFFDPKTKYIWDLAVDKDGTVYVATGDTGKIFSVAPDGKGQVFYSSDETHVRSLAFDASGNVLAGTEPSGRVLRIPKAANNRRAFVLYETSKKEITALLQAANGDLYVAAVGEKTATAPGSSRPISTDTTTTSNFVITLGPSGNVTGGATQGPLNPFTPLTTANSSSVYRIASDGSPEELWSSRDDVVYSIGLLTDGRLLLGTGNDGGVLKLEGNHIFSKLVKAASRQVTGIAAGPGGKLFLAAANPGKVFSWARKMNPKERLNRSHFDSHIFSRWGLTLWQGENIDTGNDGGGSASRVAIYARSGNTSDPASNWSDWSGPYTNPSGDKIDSPSARFVQWKAVLRAGSGNPPPAIDWFSIAYLPKNIAPEVTAISLQDPGVRVPGVSLPAVGNGPQTPAQLHMPQPLSIRILIRLYCAFFYNNDFKFGGASGCRAFSIQSRRGTSQKGYESVLWTADDVNDDQLEFAVYFSRRKRNNLEAEAVKGQAGHAILFLGFDLDARRGLLFENLVAASDAPSNPDGEGLSSERESDRFIVDNTPPAIAQLVAESVSAGVRVRFPGQRSHQLSLARAIQSRMNGTGDWKERSSRRAAG